MYNGKNSAKIKIIGNLRLAPYSQNIMRCKKLYLKNDLSICEGNLLENIIHNFYGAQKLILKSKEQYVFNKNLEQLIYLRELKL